MIVYAVFKSAVYRHECAGIFSSLAAAKECAKEFIIGERDSHHHYEVVPFDLDQQSERDIDEIHEDKPVALYTRNTWQSHNMEFVDVLKELR